MKVLLVSNYAPPHGGVAETVYYLAKYLAKSGVTITVLSFENGFDKLDKCVGAGITRPPVIKQLSGFKIGNDFIPYPWEIINLIKIIYQQQIIFLNVPYFVISNIVAILARLMRKKIICMNHGPIYISWRNRLHLPLMNFLVDQWLFLNKENITFVKKYVKKIKTYQIVKNGIELESYQVKKRKLSSEKILYKFKNMVSPSLYNSITRFVIVGRLEKEKGMEELVQLVKEFPKYEFGFIGDGPYRSELSKFKNVKIYGFLSNNLAIATMKQYDFLLSLSQRESFGLVVLQALALGLPVVVTNTNSNVKDMVRNNGIIVPVKNFTLYKKALVKISKKEIKLNTDYLINYNWPNLIDSYLKILFSINA